MRVVENDIVGVTVAKNLAVSKIFEDAGIDFCLQNQLPIKDACFQTGKNVKTLLFDLQAAPNPDNNQPKFIDMPLDELCSYIVSNYHQFLYRAIPQLKELLQNTVVKQGDIFTNLSQAVKLFSEFEKLVYRHLKLEEKEYFPFVKEIQQLLNGKKSGKKWNKRANEYVVVLEDDHKHASKLLTAICNYTSCDKPPENACQSYCEFIKLMSELQHNTQIHIVLEDSILQPKSIEMEEELLERGEQIFFSSDMVE